MPTINVLYLSSAFCLVESSVCTALQHNHVTDFYANSHPDWLCERAFYFSIACPQNVCKEITELTKELARD